jgi:hypothetical protein
MQLVKQKISQKHADIVYLESGPELHTYSKRILPLVLRPGEYGYRTKRRKYFHTLLN